MRREAAWVVVVTAALITVLSNGVGGALAVSVPDPCTVVPTTTVSLAMGVRMSVAGVRSSQPVDGTTEFTCTFSHNGAKLEISLLPYVDLVVSGGPPGMVIVTPSGLGANAHFSYELQGSDAFASASFAKDSLNGIVWDNGKLPYTNVLTLARSVYKALR